MAIDPPYRLDPLRNIISISWESLTEQTTGGIGEKIALINGRLYMEWLFSGTTAVLLYDSDYGEIAGFTPHFENFGIQGGGSLGLWPNWSSLSVSWTVTQEPLGIIATNNADFGNITLVDGNGFARFRVTGIINIGSLQWSGYTMPKEAWYPFQLEGEEIPFGG